mmetsp:Transcript_126727/g.405771  ORF Transcript_126727/g.405771 Transcript_126727/m.405771 type:complete len:209 (-) Transcript_126727:42-668(-)
MRRAPRSLRWTSSVATGGRTTSRTPRPGQSWTARPSAREEWTTPPTTPTNSPRRGPAACPPTNPATARPSAPSGTIALPATATATSGPSPTPTSSSCCSAPAPRPRAAASPAPERPPPARAPPLRPWRGPWFRRHVESCRPWTSRWRSAAPRLKIRTSLARSSASSSKRRSRARWAGCCPGRHVRRDTYEKFDCRCPVLDWPPACESR